MEVSFSMTDIDIKDIYTKEQLDVGKAIANFARYALGNSWMGEAELTNDERESRVPLSRSTFGYYRMYRWECSTCKIHGKKSPYSKAIEDGYKHFIMLKHRKNNITVKGGVFPKEQLGKE